MEWALGYIGTASVGESQEMSQEEMEAMQEIEEKKVNNIIELRNIYKKYVSYELDKRVIGANSNLYYISIVIVFIVICVDLSNSTCKNTLSSAISRKKYYLSKLITVIILGTAITLINDYFIYFFNLIINGSKFSSGLLTFTKYVLIQYPIILGMLGILVGIAFVTRKKAMFNSISIPLLMVVQLIMMGAIAIFRIDSTILTNWELQYALENLAKAPTTEYIIKTTLLGMAYFIGANLMGYQVFKKSEIK